MKKNFFIFLKKSLLFSIFVLPGIKTFAMVISNNSYVFVESYNNRSPKFKISYEDVLESFNKDLEEKNKINNLQNFSLWENIHFKNENYCKTCNKNFINHVENENNFSDFFMIIKFTLDYFSESKHYSNELLGFIPSLMVKGINSTYSVPEIDLSKNPSIYFPGVDFGYNDKDGNFSFSNLFWNDIEKIWRVNIKISIIKNLLNNFYETDLIFENKYISLPFSNNKYNKINNEISNSSLNEIPLIVENSFLNIYQNNKNDYEILINNVNNEKSTIMMINKNKSNISKFEISNNVFLKEIMMREFDIEKLITKKFNKFNPSENLILPIMYKKNYSCINNLIPEKNYYVVLMKLVDTYTKNSISPALNFVNDLYGIVDPENVINDTLDLSKEITVIFPGTASDENYNYIDEFGSLKYASAKYNPEKFFWTFYGNLKNDCRFFYETETKINKENKNKKIQKIIDENNPQIGWNFYFYKNSCGPENFVEKIEGRLKYSEISIKILKKSILDRNLCIKSIINKYDGSILDFFKNHDYSSQYMILKKEEASKIISLDEKINFLKQLFF